MMAAINEKNRSKVMRSIKPRDTSIEVHLRKALWQKGYRYRKNYKGLPGKPDIVFTKYRIAVFCDSDFFHGKDWEVLQERLLKGKNGSYWVTKIRRNMERDIENEQALIFREWTVIRFWGSEIMQDVDECVKVIEEAMLQTKLDKEE